MSAEDAILTYHKNKEDKSDHVTHNFWVIFSNKKVTTPIYEAGRPEALLVNIRDFNTMVSFYNFLQTQNGAAAA